MSAASYITGTVVILGGVFAFISKGSSASLIGSLFIGAGLLAGGYLIGNGSSFEGSIVSAGSSVILAGIAVQRYTLTGKTMPAVPLFLIGSISAAFHLRNVAKK